MSLNDPTSYQVLAEQIRQLVENTKTARTEAGGDAPAAGDVRELIRELLPATSASQSKGPQAAETVASPQPAEKGLFSSNLSNVFGLVDKQRKTNPLEFLSPVISAITSLFSSKPEVEPEPVFAKYFPFSKPQREQRGVETSSSGGSQPIDYSEQGLPRPAAAGSQPGIVVNVQAIDSRSFLDHSTEIAAAMRRALYESGGIQGEETEI